MRPLTLVGIVIALIAMWFYLNPDQAKKLIKDTPLEEMVDVTVVYKWQNAKGEWQLTDKPPEGDIPYETVKHNKNANVMPLFPKKDGE